MIPFKINNVRYQIPTQWSDVTMRQYVGLLNVPNGLQHQISFFTGIPVEVLMKVELHNLEKIAIALSFLTTAPKFEPGPSPTLAGQKIPTDITIKSLGKLEYLKGLMSRIPKDLTDSYAALADLYTEACAVYLMNDFDPELMPETKATVYTYPCTEVMRTGAFFLFKPLNLMRNTATRSPSITQRLRRWSQGLPGYRRILVFLLSFSMKARR